MSDGLGAASGRSGWGGCGTAGLARLWMWCTVSTRQSVPRGRYPLAPPAGGPSRASPAIPLPRRRGRRKAERADSADSSGSDHRRAASNQTPSIDVREDPRTLLRPGFIARPQPAVIEERGSDALPADGMALIVRGRLSPADRLAREIAMYLKRQENFVTIGL